MYLLFSLTLYYLLSDKYLYSIICKNIPKYIFYVLMLYFSWRSYCSEFIHYVGRPGFFLIEFCMSGSTQKWPGTPWKRLPCCEMTVLPAEPVWVNVISDWFHCTKYSLTQQLGLLIHTFVINNCVHIITLRS